GAVLAAGVVPLVAPLVAGVEVVAAGSDVIGVGRSGTGFSSTWATRSFSPSVLLMRSLYRPVRTSMIAALSAAVARAAARANASICRSIAWFRLAFTSLLSLLSGFPTNA